ncbi:MAG: hypothetical protein HOO91_13590 [Bacteroidales bacterium]|nr:hypothetical protein [Bacteroidales bacterium]
MKRVLFVCLLQLLILSEIKSQDTIIANLGFVNRYVWRGQVVDPKPNLQPFIEAKKNCFSLGFWGSYNFDSFSQTNLYTKCNLKNFTLLVKDHFHHSDTSNINYFDYNSKTSNHAFEMALTYQIGKFDLTLSSFLYGNDRDSKGNNRYSTYGECDYRFNLKNFTGSFFLGAGLNKSLYANELSIVNLGASFKRTIVLCQSVTIPLNFVIITNPKDEKVYLIFEILL